MTVRKDPISTVIPAPDNSARGQAPAGIHFHG